MIIMKPLISAYVVKIVREPGADPITGKMYERLEEDINIDATSPEAAVSIAHALTTIPFRGQLIRVFVDDKEFFDERF